jgi:hypothetical protein
MIIVDRKAFSIGLLLAVSFLGVLVLIFTPVFGAGMNGLQYADDLFNRLSKGSSYFIPKVAKSVETVAGAELDLSLGIEGGDAIHALALLQKSAVPHAGHSMVVRLDDKQLHLRGTLGVLLNTALRDAEDGYRNAGATLVERYGMPEKTVLATWWRLLQKLDKGLTQEKRLAEANAVRDVMRKAIEPAYNYYGIEAVHVADMVPEMAGLLLFYVLYTVWWGYAIFYLFQGCGLAMKKKAPVAASAVRQSPPAVAPGAATLSPDV